MNTMNISTLTDAELVSTFGGVGATYGWDWGDFFTAAAFATGVACKYTGNPYVCIAAVVLGGIALYL